MELHIACNGILEQAKTLVFVKSLIIIYYFVYYKCKQKAPEKAPPYNHLPSSQTITHLRSAQRQGDVLARSADLDLASAGRRAAAPDDGRARGLGARDDDLAAGQRIAKHAAQVVPHLAAVEVVGKVELRLAREEAVRVARDLEGATARHRVARELLFWTR